MKRKVIVGIVSVLLASAASASAFTLPGPLRNLTRSLPGVPGRVVEGITSGIEGAVNQQLDRWVDVAVDEVLGALGLPNPLAAGQQSAQGVGNDGLLSEAQAEIARQQGQQTAARIISQTILGSEGQQAQSQQLQQTTQSSQSVAEYAQQGQDIPVTQRKLDMMLEQNAQMAVIQSNIYSQAQQTTAQVATANNTLAEINSAQTREELARLREAEAAANDILNFSAITGQMGNGRYF